MPDSFSIKEFKIYALSEQAVTINFGDKINVGIASKISNFNLLLQKNPFSVFKISVPAYTTLTIFYDLISVFRSDLPGTNGFEKVSNYLKMLNP